MASQNLKKPQNITDQLSAGWLQIEREKSQLVAALNGLLVGFLITDDHNNVVSANPAAEKILSKKSSGWNLSELEAQLKGDFALVKSANESLYGKKTSESSHLQYNDKYLKFYLSPIQVLKEGLAVIGTAIIITDVTQEILDQEKRLDLLSIATHQIKAPFTIIRGDTELILKQYPNITNDPGLRDLITDIQEETQNGISIAHDFLNIARLEEGRVQFKKEILNLPKLIEGVIKNFDTIIKVKGLYLKLDPSYDSNLPQVCADTEALKHVVFNLIDNAIKFTERGGIKISLESQSEFVKVRIADTGPGIPEDKQKNLFEKFTPQDASKSSGLGLYIARLFTENMGGKLILEKSKAGEGTTFLFSVPNTKPSSGSVIVTLEN